MKSTILVIEDDTRIQDVIQRALADSDRVIIQALSGESAMEMAEGKMVNLVIVDIGLPGMSGYETTQKLRASLQFGQIPFVFMSGKSPAEDNGRAFASGGQTYLKKPFDINELRKIVRLALGC